MGLPEMCIGKIFGDFAEATVVFGTYAVGGGATDGPPFITESNPNHTRYSDEHTLLGPNYDHNALPMVPTESLMRHLKADVRSQGDVSLR